MSVSVLKSPFHMHTQVRRMNFLAPPEMLRLQGVARATKCLHSNSPWLRDDAECDAVRSQFTVNCVGGNYWPL